MAVNLIGFGSFVCAFVAEMFSNLYGSLKFGSESKVRRSAASAWIESRFVVCFECINFLSAAINPRCALTFVITFARLSSSLMCLEPNKIENLVVYNG